jgi:hypothetical protein
MHNCTLNFGFASATEPGLNFDSSLEPEIAELPWSIKRSIYTLRSINFLQKSMRERFEVCVSYYGACDVWRAGSRGDFAILYLAQSLAPVPYGIDA